jgi:hypothetical protein
MTIYTCTLNGDIIELGNFGATLVKHRFYATLFVFQSHEGRLGFDRSVEGEAAAMAIISDAWLFYLKTKEVQVLSRNKECIDKVWSFVRPVAVTMLKPDAEMLLEIERVHLYSKKMKSIALLKKYGKQQEMPEPPVIANLFEDIAQWSEVSLNFAIKHSMSLVLWRFGAGEFGLHCIAISKNILPLSMLFNGVDCELIEVSRVSEMPVQ